MGGSTETEGKEEAPRFLQKTPARINKKQGKEKPPEKVRSKRIRS